MGDLSLPSSDKPKIPSQELQVGMAVQTPDGQWAGEITRRDDTGYTIKWEIFQGSQLDRPRELEYDFDVDFGFIES